MIGLLIIGMSSLLSGWLAYLLASRVGDANATVAPRAVPFRVLASRLSRRLSQISAGSAPDLSRSKLGRALVSLVPSRPEVEADQRSALRRSGVQMSVASFHVLRILLAAAGLLAGLLAGSSLLFAAAGLVVGVVLPYALLARIRAVRREAIERDLPAALDIMCVTVSAGGTFENAIRAVAGSTDGPLSQGLREVLTRSRYMDITDALQGFSDSVGLPPLTILAASLAMSRDSGTRLIDVLRGQAHAVRVYRRQRLEERINRLPIKLIFPIVFFIFPALFGVVLLPAVFQIIASTSGL